MTEVERSTRMDVEEARGFARSNNRAVLATYRRDGSAQMTPVLVGVMGDGRLAVSTSERAAKTANVRRDPRVALCLLSERFYGPSVQVSGTASVLSLPEAMEPLVEYYRAAAGTEHPDWDEYREAMANEKRCLLLVEVERAA